MNNRSGSVATIKIPLIITNLTSSSSPHYIQNLSIRVILTKAAAHFFNGTSAEQPSLAALASLPSVEAVYQDEDEMSDSWIRGAGILHINLRKWADMLVIAPLSANTLAKTVNGICDGLLTNLIRAWDTSGLVDGKKKRIVVFPGMYPRYPFSFLWPFAYLVDSHERGHVPAAHYSKTSFHTGE